VTRVTADSNILISAFLRGGKPLEFLELARAGQIELGVSGPILEKAARVLKDWFHVCGRRPPRFAAELLGFAKHVIPAEVWVPFLATGRQWNSPSN
jgi:hypothetical protein